MATALLGVLLWVVISIVVNIANAPDEPLPLPKTSVAEFDPSLPRINTPEDMAIFLTEQGYAGAALIRGYWAWMAERGYPLESFEGLLPDQQIVNEDDAELILMAGAGDLDAAHMLAERSLHQHRDPLGAIEWYDQAIVNGSIFAMLRVADLITTLSDPALNEFVAEPEWKAALEQLNNELPPPLERALAWTLAAIIVGGYPVSLGPLETGQIELLVEQLDRAGVERACELAQTYVLDTAAQRRVNGGAIFSAQPPPLAFTVANPAAHIPCSTPIMPLVSLDNCARYDYVGPRPSLMSAWVCPY